MISLLFAFFTQSMLKKSHRLFVALLALSLTVGAEAALAKSVLRFRSPNRGTPIATRGGASRGPDQLKELRAIAPRGNFGLTTADRPSILVFLPKANHEVLKVTLKSPDGKKTLFKREYLMPAAPGIVKIDLTDANTPALALNRGYRWSVSLFYGSVDRSTGSTIEGFIERVKPDAKLTQSLKTVKPEQRPAVYAQNSVWWDMILTLDELRKQSPNNKDLEQQWKSVLEDAGLSAIANLPYQQISRLPSK
jgi:hypothetical protein